MGISIWQLVIIVVAVVFNLIPAFIAFRRRHTRKWLVVLVSFLTIIGWIIALFWAINGETEEEFSSIDETFQ